MDLENIVVDITQRNYNTIQTIQYDVDSRYINVKIVNNGKNVDLTNYMVSIACKKPDGKIVFNETEMIEPKQGLIKFLISEQITTALGEVVCELKIYGRNSSVLTTQYFTINVTQPIANKRIQSTNEFRQLTIAMNEYNAWVDKVKDKYDWLEEEYAEELTSVKSGLEETNAQLSDITIVMHDCVGDGVTDNSTIIQDVINRVDNHATLKFLDGVFKLNTDIDYRDKSIKILVSAKTEFIGVGRFPTYETNPWHEQNGNNFIIKPSRGKIWNNEKCGDSAISCEVSPTRSYQGNAVAGFFSAKTNDCQGDVWALNPIVKVDENFKGTAQGMEIDIDNMSETANVTGLTLTGWGAYNPENAIFISRHNTDDNTHTYWKTGVTIKEVVNGVGVMGAKDNGLVVVDGKKGGYIASNQECGLELTNNHVDLSIHGSSNGVIIKNTDEPIKIIAKAGNDYSPSIYGTNSENNAVMYKILQNGEGHFSSLNIGDGTIIASGLIASNNQPLRLTSENGEAIIIDGRTKQILPQSDNVWDIGSSTKKFKGMFLVNSPVVTSKREMKENIKLFNDESAYESIKKIPIYTYNYIDGDGENMLGSMLDELPNECINDQGEGVDLYAYTSYCISALKVAIKKIEELENKIETNG